MKNKIILAILSTAIFNVNASCLSEKTTKNADLQVKFQNEITELVFQKIKI